MHHLWIPTTVSTVEEVKHILLKLLAVPVDVLSRLDLCELDGSNW